MGGCCDSERHQRPHISIDKPQAPKKLKPDQRLWLNIQSDTVSTSPSETVLTLPPYMWSILAQYLSKAELLTMMMTNKKMRQAIEKHVDLPTSCPYIPETTYIHYFEGANIFMYDILTKRIRQVTLKQFRAPFGSDSIQVNNRIFLTGGLGELANKSSEYYRGVIVKKCDMLYEHMHHCMADIHHCILYAIGSGISENGTDFCENYDIALDLWRDSPKLLFPTFKCSAVTVNDRYIYTFGGCAPIQRLDSWDENPGWGQIKVMGYEQLIQEIRSPGSVQISKDKILIFGGSIIPESTSYRQQSSYILNLQDFSIQKQECYLEIPDEFFSRKPAVFCQEVFVFGTGDIFVYSILTQSWRIINWREKIIRAGYQFAHQQTSVSPEAHF